MSKKTYSFQDKIKYHGMRVRYPADFGLRPDSSKVAYSDGWSCGFQHMFIPSNKNKWARVGKRQSHAFSIGVARGKKARRQME